MVYPHTIDSAAVQLCPDGDLKVIRLLSKGFLAGVKGDLRDQACKHSMANRGLLATEVPPTEIERLNVLKEMQLP